MQNWYVWTFLFLHFFMASPTALGQVQDVACPVSYELSYEEKAALKHVEFRLQQVDHALGKPFFERRLTSVLEKSDILSQNVIDVSPYFLELLAYHIDLKRLEDAIARTIGLDHPNWIIFKRDLTRILSMHAGGGDREKSRFSKAAQNLLKSIRTVGPRGNRNFARRNYTAEEGDLQKQRAASAVGRMYIVIEERVRAINNEIARQRREAFWAGAGLQAIRILSVGVVVGLTVATAVYWGPVVGAVSLAVRGAVATDALVAAHMARIGQAVAGAVTGGALGAVGAPAAQLVMDSHSAITKAELNSLNNRTSLACELNKKMEEWRERGASPYLRTAVFGGSLGLSAGGIYLLPKVGSQVVMSLYTFGVGVTAAYSLGNVTYYQAMSMHEYALARDAMDEGDETLARQHLHKSREYAQLGGEKQIESVLLIVLSVTVGTSFKSALAQGSEQIASIVANSADTMPVAIMAGAEMAVRAGQYFNPQ